MSFNDQVKSKDSGGTGFGIWQPGVKTVKPNKKGGLAFRIMPAFPSDESQKTEDSWVPFRDPEGNLSDWGAALTISTFVGHGGGKGGSREDVVSPQTFDPDQKCPIQELVSAAKQVTEWNYLVTEAEDGPDKGRQPLPFPSQQLLLNIVDTHDPEMSAEVRICKFTKSAYDSLFSDNGVAAAPSSAATEEMLAQDYTLQWACGDLTNPQNGPVLMCKKDESRGKYGSYVISMLTNPTTGQVQRYPVGRSYLTQRWDFSDISNVVKPVTREQTIGHLASLLNQRGPNGHHEWEFLREVFPQVSDGIIPSAPSAPAASNTVQSGFAPRQEAPARQQNSFGPGPSQGGAIVPGSDVAPPPAAPQRPTPPDPAPVPDAPAPAPQPAQANDAPPPPSGGNAAPAAPQPAPGNDAPPPPSGGNAAPAAPQPAPGSDAPPPPAGSPAQQQAPQAAPTPPQQSGNDTPPPPAATAPGDEVDQEEKAAFLAELKERQGE